MVSSVSTLRNPPDLYGPGGSLVIVDAFPPPGLMRFIVKTWVEYLTPAIARFFMCTRPTLEERNAEFRGSLGVGASVVGTRAPLVM
jgi:hypothetical protein